MPFLHAISGMLSWHGGPYFSTCSILMSGFGRIFWRNSYSKFNQIMERNFINFVVNFANSGASILEFYSHKSVGFCDQRWGIKQLDLFELYGENIQLAELLM